ncbi:MULTISPECIES: hypothetical protein [Acinetobacter]|uniref:Uncharacterized protein n=2 Tax=Acinetobacter haemolyticus TaxID=29430 RepID=A0A2K8PVA5_ACIHA|nr:hypothetical protein [Acinetobacter haemolyticus]ATZ66661.1 hypothetical protein BSR56_04340 [Acinetobacter haemolyticus]AZN67073.1 hypothetical protein DX910_00825 [Acinetobacter haemolyticus]ENW19289.1 hypothetical protein F926_02856 [Acinetobacter haemolyticus NIPH 261]MBO3657918.1 hypothetical protein [Acinetobacter haemolyticus]NAR18661.1 hypothetical protein [Acinetobacter haemolyticus]
MMSKEPTKEQTVALEQLAQQLRRPVMSFQDFSQLSEQHLAWLNQQLQQTIEDENRKINQHLFQMPFFLRALFRSRNDNR